MFKSKFLFIFIILTFIIINYKGIIGSINYKLCDNSEIKINAELLNYMQKNSIDYCNLIKKSDKDTIVLSELFYMYIDDKDLFVEHYYVLSQVMLQMDRLYLEDVICEMKAKDLDYQGKVKMLLLSVYNAYDIKSDFELFNFDSSENLKRLHEFVNLECD